MASVPLRLLQELLLAWYQKNKRPLPWRELVSFKNWSVGPVPIRDPYTVTVSEMMLQQTQVQTVLPKYAFFLQRFSSLESLSAAPLAEVVIAWKGLGYNRRAKHLLETAKLISKTYDGVFPSDEKTLRTLPGFGPYMVAAIQVFAFGIHRSVIDVNVARVLTRTQVGLDPIPVKELAKLAQESVPKGYADEWHQGLMDFGSQICTAKAPRCAECPVSRICTGNQLAKAQGFSSYAAWLLVHPVKKKTSLKDSGKRFEETDRYFRGRIIDYLRQGSLPMVELQEKMRVEHHLDNRVRFGSLIEALMVDGLIQILETTVRLKTD
ncbi:A/G-specific adenine glycosylase [Candidatus Woesebacteria bacterium]|nr:A/G-specific adenine glycosylase [Candidatus Woesebacteria bacterium]